MSEIAMIFPPPSRALLQQARADAPRGKRWTWMQALPQTIQQCLSRWQIKWTGESLNQGYFGYVLPCRCQDGTHAILKLSPLAQEAQEQVIALSAWAGGGAPRLLAESCDEHGGSLLIGRIRPGAALWPRDDPDGQRIAECLEWLAGVPALSVRGSLPSGLQRLTAQLAANERHLHALNPVLRRHHDAMTALAHAVDRSQRPREQAVLLHGDLHAGNLLLDGSDRLVAIDPSPAIGEPEQDIGNAAALNDWGQALPERVKRPKCAALTRARCGLTPGLPLGTPAFSTLPPEPSHQEAWTPTNCLTTRAQSRRSPTGAEAACSIVRTTLQILLMHRSIAGRLHFD